MGPLFQSSKSGEHVLTDSLFEATALVSAHRANRRNAHDCEYDSRTGQVGARRSHNAV